MGKCEDLTKEKIVAVNTLLKNTELSQRQIAIKCGVSQSSVRRIKEKMAKEGVFEASRRGRCGKKPIVTPRGKRILRNLAKEFRRASHSELQKKFQEAGVSVSTCTLRRNLYELGFKCRRPVRKPRLTPAMVKKRLQWAYAHKHLTVEDWRIVST